VDKSFELDVSGVSTSTSDQSLVFDSAHGPADVWSHGTYNKSSRVPTRRMGG
jgi:hypothetical protein